MKKNKPTFREGNLAAVDVGTNSFHLIVAHVNPDLARNGKFKIITREKALVRLGSGGDDMKRLSEAAMERGLVALKRFRRVADAMKAPLRAVATSAVREADNRDEFLKRVRKQTGVRIEVIPGFEEARLIYMGLLQALPVFEKKILSIDIGGGSTEFLVGRRREVLHVNSLKLGAVRLTDHFFRSKKLKEKDVKECRKFIRGVLSPVARDLRGHGRDVVVGTSGTIQNVAHMIKVRKGEEFVNLNGFSFSKQELMDLVDEILSEETASERSRIEGLDPKRSDIIVAGILILEAVFEQLGVKNMTVSEFALREGVLLDTVEKMHLSGDLHLLDDLRRRNVLHLAEHFGYEKEHSRHVANLALSIFDQMRSWHKMGGQEREYLEAAALLHEIGFFLSHDQHHRHSYYLIRNSELMGFTDDEREIIANIARYHRKSHPKPKHAEFSRLDPKEQILVRKLAGILRIADGLDRTHRSIVEDVFCRRRDGNWTIALRKKYFHDAELEVWGAERKKALFEEAFRTKVQFRSLEGS